MDLPNLPMHLPDEWRDEVFAILRQVDATFVADLESGALDNTSTFNQSRNLGPECYADCILARTREVGVLHAACEDVADAIGETGDPVRALTVIAKHWENLAAHLGFEVTEPIDVLLAAHSLRTELAAPCFDASAAMDVISVRWLKDELINTAITLRKADSAAAWWDEHGNDAWDTIERLRDEHGIDASTLRDGTR